MGRRQPGSIASRRVQGCLLSAHPACPSPPPAPQLTGCTLTKLTGWTDTRTTTGAQVTLLPAAYGITFKDGFAFLGDFTGRVVVCSEDLTGCLRLYACVGASTPATVNGGCLSTAGSSNAVRQPLRFDFAY